MIRVFNQSFFLDILILTFASRRTGIPYMSSGSTLPHPITEHSCLGLGLLFGRQATGVLTALGSSNNAISLSTVL